MGLQSRVVVAQLNNTESRCRAAVAQTLDYRSGVLEKTIISVQLVPLLLKDRGFIKNKVNKID